MIFKKEAFFFFAVVLVGVLDWLTTVTGIFFFGAAEVNPVLSGVTKSSMLLFSFIKLSAVVFVGFAFYKAAGMCQWSRSDWHFTKTILCGGFSFTFLVLTVVATSNMITIFRV